MFTPPSPLLDARCRPSSSDYGATGWIKSPCCVVLRFLELNPPVRRVFPSIQSVPNLRPVKHSWVLQIARRLALAGYKKKHQGRCGQGDESNDLESVRLEFGASSAGRSVS